MLTVLSNYIQNDLCLQNPLKLHARAKTEKPTPTAVQRDTLSRSSTFAHI